MAALELRPAIVAFLDILGFGQMVATDCQSVPGTSNHVERLYRAHLKVQEFKGAGEISEIIQFSDSIVITAECSERGFVGIVRAVAAMQRELLRGGILIRGGIAYGKQFHQSAFLFSQALIEAFRIEQDVAIGPRVIVSRDLLDLLFPDMSFDETLPMVAEKDGLVFVDYLGEEDGALAEVIVDLWSRNRSAPIYGEKYDWLLEFAHYRWPKVKLPAITRFTHPKEH